MEVRNPQIYREICKTITRRIFLIVTSIIRWTIERPATYTRLGMESITTSMVMLPLSLSLRDKGLPFDTILTS